MIYLDNAATSYPKPASVCNEVYNCLNNYCGNPGRGAHSLSMKAAEKVFDCRVAAADFFGCGKPENIIFTLNTTYALNMIIKGVLRRSDHVIISDLEHNSVFRPIYRMAREGLIEYDVFDSMTLSSHRTATSICAGIASLIRTNTRLIICTQSSNICSAVLPLREIGALCRRRNIIFAVDAAQSAGHIDIDMSHMNIDALCAPGHKGLLGPQGSGILALNGDVSLDTLIEGGNGINSLEGNMSEFPPERYESGTLAVPAIAGLLEGIKKVNEIGALNIRAHTQALYMRLFEMLSLLPGVNIYAPEHTGSVLLFNVKNIPSDTVSRELDNRGICVRSGFHCSPLGHAALKTPSYGAVRASFGIYNTVSDIEALWKAVREISNIGN